MTVITPDALQRSNFRPATVDDLLSKSATHDESFVFIFPSPNLINEMNGDGDLIGIDDIARDKSHLVLEDGSCISVNDPNLKIYVR